MSKIGGVTVLAEGLAHPEGPAVLPDGRVVFVETFLGQLSVWDAEHGVTLFADVGGGPGACTVGVDGVYFTQNGGRIGQWQASRPSTPSIQKVTWGGEVQTIAASASGMPLLAPNDLTFAADGRLWFTDPGEFDPSNPVNGHICVVDPDGAAEIAVETGPVFPNGIAVERDGSILWDESYTRTVVRLRENRSPELVATLPEGHVVDGLKTAQDGRIYVAAGSVGGIDVLSPQGELIESRPLGGDVLNCAFQGRDLYVTDFGTVQPSVDNGFAPAAGRLLRFEVDVAGTALHEGAVAGLV
jgi:gluconolactonase